MLLPINHLRGYAIHASDGHLGKASDFYFDDMSWTIRYLIVDTGWLFGRKVLIAPEAIKQIDRDEAELHLDLTEQQIEEAPDIDTELPVSRQQEVAMRNWFHWPNYWDAFTTGTVVSPLIPPVRYPETAGSSATAAEREAVAEASGSPHLRSVQEVTDYRIHARDGEIGHVQDFVLDSDQWSIRYLIVDTGNWLPGRRVLIAPRWAESIDWDGGQVWVTLDRKAVKDSPPYDPAKTIDRDYETAIHEFHRFPPYWT